MYLIYTYRVKIAHVRWFLFLFLFFPLVAESREQGSDRLQSCAYWMPRNECYCRSQLLWGTKIPAASAPCISDQSHGKLQNCHVEANLWKVTKNVHQNPHRACPETIKNGCIGIETCILKWWKSTPTRSSCSAERVHKHYPGMHWVMLLESWRCIRINHRDNCSWHTENPNIGGDTSAGETSAEAGKVGVSDSSQFKRLDVTGNPYSTLGFRSYCKSETLMDLGFRGWRQSYHRFKIAVNCSLLQGLAVILSPAEIIWSTGKRGPVSLLFLFPRFSTLRGTTATCAGKLGGQAEPHTVLMSAGLRLLLLLLLLHLSPTPLCLFSGFLFGDEN